MIVKYRIITSRFIKCASQATVVRVKLSTIQRSSKNHDRVDSTIIQKLSTSFHTPAPDIFIPCISRDGFTYFRSGGEVDKNLGVLLLALEGPGGDAQKGQGKCLTKLVFSRPAWRPLTP